MCAQQVVLHHCARLYSFYMLYLIIIFIISVGACLSGLIFWICFCGSINSWALMQMGHGGVDSCQLIHTSSELQMSQKEKENWLKMVAFLEGEMCNICRHCVELAHCCQYSALLSFSHGPALCTRRLHVTAQTIILRSIMMIMHEW